MTTGPSVLITAAPTLAFDSATVTSVTLNLTAIPTNADAVTIAYRTRGATGWTMSTERTATGTFSIAGLTAGESYWFVAIPQESNGKLGPASLPLQVTLNGAGSVFGLEELMEALRDALKAAVWPGSATRVFGDSVYVVAQDSIAQTEISKIRMPGALLYELGDGGGLVDETPQFRKQRVGLTILTAVAGDTFGEKVLTGQRASEVVSPGAGLYDLHQAVLTHLDRALRNGSYPVRFIGVLPSSNGSVNFDQSQRIGTKHYALTFAMKEA